MTFRAAPTPPAAPLAFAGQIPGYGTPLRRRRAPVRLRAALFGLLAGLVVGGAVLGLSALSGGGSGGAGANVASDCGANIGRDGRVAFVAYVESNIARSQRNSVIAIPYRAGDMKPLKMSQCSTGGSGAADLTDSGALDADYQLITNPQHTLLFAVNQGSDSIAVFHIRPNGALTPVTGSPFASGGTAPGSVGLSGNTLVVSNKAQDGVRDLRRTAPNYTTFTVAADGRLTRVPGSAIPAKPGSSPDVAFVPPQGGVAIGTEESGPVRGFAISPAGVLTQAQGSPNLLPPSVFGPGFDPYNEFPLGVAAHPSRRLVYIAVPAVPALAIYSWATTGKLTFVASVSMRGSYLPCWIQVTGDGRWLYTANADTNNVTAFDLSKPTHPRQIQTLRFRTPGDPWNEALDPSGKFLFVNTPRNTLMVPEGQGNTQHVMSIAADGKLTELNASAPVRIPVPGATNPQGLAVVAGGG